MRRDRAARAGVDPRRPVPDPRGIGRDPSRLDPFAPDWLVRVLRPTKAPLPVADAVRVALTLTVPLGLAMAGDRTAFGVYAAIGAIAAGIADRGGSRADRVLRQLAGLGFGVVGLVVGRAAAGEGLAAVAVVAALGVVSALVSTVSATLSFGGLQLLVHAALASGLPAAVGDRQAVLAFLAGGAWAVLLSYLETLVVGAPQVQRDAVVRVARAIAALLAAPGAASREAGFPEPERRELTAALDAAYDRLLGARAVSSGRRRDLERRLRTLTALSPLVSAAVATARAGRSTAALAATVSELAAALDRDDRDWRPRTVDDDGDGHATATRSLLREAVLEGVDRAARAASDDPPANLPSAGPRPAPSRLLLGRTAWTFAARLALTLGVAEATRQLVPFDKPYWIVLTAALVLKPDFGSVFARGLQRVLGTLVGVVIGAAVLLVVPDGPALLIPVAVFAAVVPVAMARNYGMFSTFLTPLVLLLLDVGAPVGPRIAGERLLDTLVGAGVVLVVGYLLWPQTWAPHLARQVATASAALGDFARAAFGPDRPAAGRARRRAYRSVSDARAALQTALSEPPPFSRRAAAWWPVLQDLERAADDLTTAMVVARDEARVPPDRDVVALGAGFDALAEGIRARRRPTAVGMPPRSPLAAVAADVEAARRALVGPS